MSLLIRHYVSYLARKKEDKGYSTRDQPKKDDLTKDEKDLCTRLYKELREEYGFYPDSLDFDGKIIWGSNPKSKVQLLAESSGDSYSEIGEKIINKKGGLGEAMNSRRIKGYDEDIPEYQR